MGRIKPDFKIIVCAFVYGLSATFSFAQEQTFSCGFSPENWELVLSIAVPAKKIAGNYTVVCNLKQKDGNLVKQMNTSSCERVCKEPLAKLRAHGTIIPLPQNAAAKQPNLNWGSTKMETAAADTTSDAKTETPSLLQLHANKTGTGTGFVTIEDRNKGLTTLPVNTKYTLSESPGGKRTMVAYPTDSSGNMTRQTYVDDTLTKTEYGKESNGKFVSEYSSAPPGSKAHGNNGNTYSFIDADGNRIEAPNAQKAKEIAAIKGAKKITITDANGKMTVVDAETGKVAQTEKNKDGKTDPSDPCSLSVAITGDQKYACRGTDNWVKGAEVGNQVLNTAGRTMVTSMGANAAQNARGNRGTSVADSMDASAKMAKTSFSYEASLAVLNLAATAKLTASAKKHKENSTALKARFEGKDLLALEDPAQRKADYNVAIAEQNGARERASQAAFLTTMNGVKSLAAAMTAKKIQKGAEENARLDRKNQQQMRDNAFSYDPTQLLPRGQGVNGFSPNGNAITGGTGAIGSLTAKGDTSNVPDGEGAGLLGKGNDSGAGDDSLAAPRAGAHKLGTSPGGGGGGGGGGASAGAGGAPSGGAPAEDVKASYASEFGTKERYENGGAGGAKPGAKAGAGGAHTGLDLNGLLAQFLPKGEEDTGPKNGILDAVDFNGGARNLATEEAPSYLDKNADLFQRIHETMSERNRRGLLGI